jgi:hypothetical protein
MRRLSLRHVLSGALLAGFAMLSGVGCSEADNSSMFIRGVLALQSPDCIAKADPSSTMLLEGVLDLAFRTNYQAALLVGNQLVAQGSHDQVRTETSRIVVKGAIVTVRDAKGASLTSYTVDATGVIDPASGSDPNYGVVAVELIPDSLQLTPNTRVTADVQVFGDTLGDRSITSADLLFPIEVCYGCLVSFPADAIDPTTPNQCVGTTTQDEPCFVGQDAPIDCRLCVGNPVCKPP